MSRRQKHRVILQFVAVCIAIGIICSATAFGAFTFFTMGRGNLTWSNAKATQLTNTELTQLVGTISYDPHQVKTTPSMISSIVDALKPTITNPLAMLTTQLPLTSIQASSRNQTESSLFHSITSWANTSGKIAMGWIPSTSTSASIQMLKDNPGITVASPVWLHLNDASGNITGHILPSFVQYAHQHHIKVWVMVDNGFNASLTHKVLQNPKAAANMADELAYKAKLYHLDGINVDFENVAAADRTAFTQFLRLLHQKLSTANVDLSVDISPDVVPLRDNAAFFHAGIASIVDHVILMAYDEHWHGEQSPGPVADVPWVKQSVYDLLNTGVPTDKLILGMPFYSRFWYVHKNGHITDQAVSDGSIQSILQKHHATGTFNPKLDLMYVKYPEPDGYMEGWYPNNKTLQDKFAIVGNTGLAGVAVWSLQLSNQKTWVNMLTTLKKAVSS